ncbi:MAG: glycoside hydrolase family 130 protein, partial [Planctomycetota bacterium]
MLARVVHSFSSRHHCLDTALLHHFKIVKPYIDAARSISPRRRLLIGAHFTMEYSIESAALFNPSIVPGPDQSGRAADDMRILMSLRATGEGHISSIVFRQGVIHDGGKISFDTTADSARTGEVLTDRLYSKKLFLRKLIEMQCHSHEVDGIMARLSSRFTMADLELSAADLLDLNTDCPATKAAVDHVRHLAQANYELCFDDHTDPGDMVIFPIAAGESAGMEDVRLVRFTDDDGLVTYYGTYTAYDGFNTLPQMFETTDFRRFRIMTLTGKCARNKGMALFPRKIGGRYMMVSRLDGTSLYLMTSDNPHIWNDATLLQKPVRPWESVQIGNCGSPLETDRGWLLLTHGVGPMRQYCIGALLLDLDDPRRVIGRTREPILVPTEDERDGYVPNVVYTCGAIIHKDKLVMPYAMSD